MEQLPAYSLDFNPIEHLWKKVKKEATHLKHFPEFTDLQQEVTRHYCMLPKRPEKSRCSWLATVKSSVK
jgi:transposase